MPKKSKKFIEKKNSVTFHLVHRSQRDPLAADDTAPQRVLLPVQESNKPETKNRVEEQKQFGIFFDDDYNYLQHLRDINNETEWVAVGSGETIYHKERKLQLPSSVFESNVKEEIGLLNKAAPSGLRLDLDAEVIAALDEDFDFDDPDNQLDDNFMEFANASDDCSDECDDYESIDTDEARDEVASLNESQFSFKDEETRSRFTDYSMSSSVIRRNSQLTLLDDRFEKMYSDYDDNEIGALDCDEIEGDVSQTSDILMQCADEFQKQQQKEYLDNNVLALRLQRECGSSSEDEGESNLIAMPLPQKEKWDCESVLTTYTNIYNHPKLITEPKNSKIKINSKTGIPKNVLSSSKLTAKKLLMLDAENYTNIGQKRARSEGANSVISMLSCLSVRNKHETSDEKKKRKRLLKEYRKDRREEKKINAKAFKEENIRQAKITINNNNNVQGNKIL